MKIYSYTVWERKKQPTLVIWNAFSGYLVFPKIRGYFYFPGINICLFMVSEQFYFILGKIQLFSFRILLKLFIELSWCCWTCIWQKGVWMTLSELRCSSGQWKGLIQVHCQFSSSELEHILWLLEIKLKETVRLLSWMDASFTVSLCNSVTFAAVFIERALFLRLFWSIIINVHTLVLSDIYISSFL